MAERTLQLKYMGLTDIKKELKKLDKDKLIELVSELYKKNKSVKEFFDFYVNPNERELFNKYRDAVFEAFYPKRGYNYNSKTANKQLATSKNLDLRQTYSLTLCCFTLRQV